MCFYLLCLFFSYPSATLWDVIIHNLCSTQNIRRWCSIWYYTSQLLYDQRFQCVFNNASFSKGVCVALVFVYVSQWIWIIEKLWWLWDLKNDLLCVQNYFNDIKTCSVLWTPAGCICCSHALIILVINKLLSPQSSLIKSRVGSPCVITKCTRLISEHIYVLAYSCSVLHSGAVTTLCVIKTFPLFFCCAVEWNH